MSGWLAVLSKEVYEGFKDRRTWSLALVVYPMMNVCFAVFFMPILLDTMKTKFEKPTEIVVLGAEQAPQLLNFIEQKNVELRSVVSKEDMRQAIRENRKIIGLHFFDDYQENWRNHDYARVEIMVDTSSNDAEAGLGRVRAILDQWNLTQRELKLLLIADESIDKPKTVYQVNDLAPVSSMAVRMFYMLPWLLILTTATAGMMLAIEATAGERERKSLEPLLLTPVSAAQMVAGKVLATTAFQWIGVGISLIGIVIGLKVVPLSKHGIDFSISFWLAFKIFLVLMPLALMMSALLNFASAFAKTFREAQQYNTFLVMLPTFTLFYLMFLQPGDQLWHFLPPLFGQATTLDMLLKGKPVLMSALTYQAFITLAIASLVWQMLVIKYRNTEKLLLGSD